MARNIAENAVVHPDAGIGEDVVIGPFCVVGPKVTIGSGTHLESHVNISGRVTVGENNRISPTAVIGGEPQDLSYRGSDTEVIIGDGNVIREGVTIHRASEKEDGTTVVGDGCYFMACSHVAHDCKIGDRVVLANNVLLAGHVHVQDHVTISGAAAVHHFATIGCYSFIGGLSRVIHDVPPFMLIEGSPARPRCVNVVALKRNEFPADAIKALSEAHRLLFRAKVGLDHAREILRSNNHLLPTVNHLLGFIQDQQEGRHGRGRDKTEGRMKPLRIAIIGAGHLGKIHARLLKTVDDAELVGVVDPVTAVREQVAEDLGTAAFANHEPLIDQIDAAIIATPTVHHHAVGMELLQAGIHVFIEKPIASSVDEARELVAAARRSRRILQVGHVERFNPAWTAARPLLSGARYIEAVRESQHSFRSTDIGVVLDLMIHDIDLVLSAVNSEVCEVDAIGFSALGQQEDVASAQLVFANGCEANLKASRVSFAANRAMQVFTDSAWSHIDFAANAAKIVQPSNELREDSICLDELTPEERTHLRENLFSTLLTVNEVEVQPRNAILDEQHDFVISIRSDNQPSVGGEDGLKALDVAQQILGSIKTHGWTSVPSDASSPSVIPLPLDRQAAGQRRAG